MAGPERSLLWVCRILKLEEEDRSAYTGAGIARGNISSFAFVFFSRVASSEVHQVTKP